MSTKTKIKVNKVNEFTFMTDNNENYGDKFPAIVSVKIENAIKEINIQKFDGSDYDRKNYIVVDDITIKFEDGYDITIKELNLELNFSDIISEYKKLLVGKEKEQEIINLDRYTKQYNESWVHNFIKEADPMIEAEDIYFKINLSLKEYIEKRKNDKFSNGFREIYIMSTYKNRKFDITIEDVYSGFSRFSRPTGEFKYCFQDDDYKTRRYKKVNSLIKKLKEYIDEKISSDKNKKEAAIKKEANKNETLKNLNNIFDNVIHRVKNSYNRYGHKHVTYSYDYYYIVIDEKKVNEYSEDGLAKISANEDYSLFNFKGFEDLTADQVKDILKIVRK